MKKNECRSCYYGDCTEFEYPCSNCTINTSNFESHSNKYKYLEPGKPYFNEECKIADENFRKKHPKIWKAEHFIGKLITILLTIMAIGGVVIELVWKK